MRIVWSSEAAEEIIRGMREAEQNLNDCLRAAYSARSALAEANPEAEDKMLNRMMDALEADIRELQQEADEMNRLVRKTREAKERFEDAEEKVSAMIDRVATGEGRGESGAADGCIYPEPIEWTHWDTVIPQPVIMPGIDRRSIFPEPEWLLKLIMNPDIFTLLM